MTNDNKNAKAIRLRRYRFTTNGEKSILINKYNKLYEENFKKWKAMTYLCFQCEIGKDSGLFHIQGYMEFRDGVNIKTIKKKMCDMMNLNNEKLRGTPQENREYCMKEDTKVIEYDFKEFGEIKTNGGGRTDWLEIKDKIDNGASYDDIVEANPTKGLIYDRNIKRYIYHKLKKNNRNFKKVDVRIYYGDAGTGKTRKVINEFGNDNVYRLSRGDNGGVWFDGYEGQKVLLIDDFNGWIRRGRLLELLDGYAFQLQVKGGFTWKAWDTVIITSNYEPNEWYNKDITKDEGFRRRIKYVEHFENTNKEIYIPTWEDLLEKGREAKEQKNKEINKEQDNKDKAKATCGILENYTEVRGNTGDSLMCKKLEILPEPKEKLRLEVDSDESLSLCSVDGCECLSDSCKKFDDNYRKVDISKRVVQYINKVDNVDKVRERLDKIKQKKLDRMTRTKKLMCYGKVVISDSDESSNESRKSKLGCDVDIVGCWWKKEKVDTIGGLIDKMKGEDIVYDNGIEDEIDDELDEVYCDEKVSFSKSLVDRMNENSDDWFSSDEDVIYD